MDETTIGKGIVNTLLGPFANHDRIKASDVAGGVTTAVTETLPAILGGKYFGQLAENVRGARPLKADRLAAVEKKGAEDLSQLDLERAADLTGAELKKTFGAQRPRSHRPSA